MSILYKVKDVLDSSHLYMLYCTLILPYLNYACEIWGNTYPSKLKSIITIQKKAIRIINKTGYREHTSSLFSSNKCLKFHDLVNLKTLILVYQARNRLLPNNVQNLFKESKDFHNYNTRSSSHGNFNVEFCRTKLKSFTLCTKGIKLWNTLDPSFKSINNFYLNLKKH